MSARMGMPAGAFAFPAHWSAFLAEHGAERADFEVPEGDDLSGLGADLQLMDEEDARQEAEDTYPGIVVCVDGYVPVGTCLAGSGDPYFIRTADGVDGPLYRVYHDALIRDGDGYRYEADAVVVVLARYTQLLDWRLD